MELFENSVIIWLSISSLSFSCGDEGERIIRGPPFSPATEAEIEGETLDKSILALAERKRRINDTFIIDAVTNATLGWSEFIEKSRRLATHLMQELGCSTGCMVGIVSENRVEYPIVYLGTWLSGATLSNFDLLSSDDELITLYGITKPSIIFCPAKHCDRLRASCPHCTFIVFDLNSSTNVSQFSTLIADVNKSYPPPVHINPDHTASIVYSSGTTGTPKAVQLSHKGLVYLNKLIHEKKMPENDGGIMVSDRGFCRGMGLVIFLIAVVRNQTLVIMPKAEEEYHDYELYLQMIEKYRVNTIVTVPTTIVFILKNEKAQKYELASLEYIVSSSSPLKPELEEQIKMRLKNLKGIIQWYGSTESMLNTTKNVDNPKLGTAGLVNPLMEMKVVNVDTKKSLGSMERGEIWIRGPTITKGYYGEPEITALAIDQDGWYHTGDIGYFDDDEDLFIVGRIKEFIKYQSYLVGPASIEAVLLKHPAVLDCAVIGIPDELNNQLPRAYIVNQSHEKVTEDDLIEFVKENASPYAHLRGGVEFVSHIPKTSTDKILRRELENMWMKKYGNKLKTNTTAETSMRKE